MGEFVAKRLIVNEAAQWASPELATGIAWAANWAKDVDYNAAVQADPEQDADAASDTKLDPKTVAALMEFSQALESCRRPTTRRARRSKRSGGAEQTRASSSPQYAMSSSAPRGGRSRPIHHGHGATRRLGEDSQGNR